MRYVFGILSLLLMGPVSVAAQNSHDPDKPTVLPLACETDLALHAAPEPLREGSGLYVFKEEGYVQVRESTNGFTCIVNRDHPHTIKPTCFDAEGTKTIVPKIVHFGRRLMEGVPVAEIQAEINEGFETGQFVPPLPFIAYQGPHGMMIVVADEQAAGPHDHMITRLSSIGTLCLFLGTAVCAYAQPVEPAPWAFEEARQFDFWIGTWDVNNRFRQNDGSWVDGGTTQAKIYRILDGKAILEFWDGPFRNGATIRGFSLRYELSESTDGGTSWTVTARVDLQRAE